MRPEYEIYDYDRFRPYVVANSAVELLHTGMRWAEGPVYFGDANCVLCSDIPSNRIIRWSEGAGASVFRYPSNHANGNTRDRQGRLVTCESGARRVTRTELDGTITVLADSFEGKRLNSPNDVVVKSDGTVWFTDPDYGILSDWTGSKAPSEIGSNNVFCFDPSQNSLHIATGGMVRPNGLAFSPDESILYVADTGGSHLKNGPFHIMQWEVGADYRLGNPRIFARVSPGVSDGFRVDVDGNVWTSAGDGVHCIAPDGVLIGKIRFPEVVSNLTFGGVKKSTLYVTTASSLYGVVVGQRGVQDP